ncbi:MAG: hypothetical protein J6M95_01295 [Bacilli bacterium]|nr:hypothetical protein [Bacilli bacterium]
MKKSKLTLGLVTSFIGALALSACNSTAAVTTSDKSIVDFIGYNSEEEKIEIDIDKFYSEYGDSSESTTLFYNAVLEALIRYEYEPLSSRAGSNLKPYATLVKEAEDKVNAQKQVATDNQKSNGTKTWDEEWEKILDSYDCEDEKDLKEHFLYELEKEAITDGYFKDNESSLKDQYIGIDKDWKPVDTSSGEFAPVFPYHILHVLVKLNADATDYSRASITSAEAEKLWNVVRKLIDATYSFEEVAYKESEDSSNTAYGDVGIMSTQTSFYNEFKLGIYAYDALLSGRNTQTADTEAIYKAFGVDDQSTIVTETKLGTDNKAVETKERVTDLVTEEMVKDVKTAITGYGDTATEFTGIPTVPYDVFRKIGEYKDAEKIGTFEPEAGSVAYPRNVLFNQFLNFRSPFVITNEDITMSESQDKVTVTEHDFETGDLKIKNNNFVQDAVPSLTGKSVLTDGEGSVIIGVRSTAGIHFMVMRKSIFYQTNFNTVSSFGDKKSDVTLQDYYTTEIPGADNYPTESYINMTKSDDPSYYTNRANTIKNKLKGQDTSDVFDAAYDYRIYQMLLKELVDNNQITFFDKDEDGHSVIAENIEKKIQLLRESKFLSNIESINGSWEDYLIQLRDQNDKRAYKGMLSTGCVFRWNRGNAADKAAFEKGGECYVK